LTEIAASDDFELPWRRRPSTPPALALHLVIVWSLEEPERVGHAAALCTDAWLGRGEPEAGEGARLRFAATRPAGDAPRWLEASRLARQQLRFSEVSPDGALVESVGRCPMSVNGSPVTSARVQPGDAITLRNAIVLLVTKRALASDVRRHASSEFPFGGADAHGLVGESAAAWGLRESLAFAGRSREHVLLLGESGSGKELSARAIHALSARAARAMVSRNAATLPDALVDAELFGNAKNYPNPGMAERGGLLGEAHASTLFLDEVGELPAAAQAHLLRVMDQGDYQRLGEATQRRSDFRLIAATNREPSALKHDFAARFPLRVRLPGLNERLEDVPLLVQSILRGLCQASAGLVDRFFERRQGHVAEPRVEPELVEWLLRHRYTTHVRELARLLWVAISTSPDDFIAATPEFLREVAANPELLVPEPDRAAIENALTSARGNVTKAARVLGLRNRYVLYRLMKKVGLESPAD
jgi:DNA-binding NtrC family response regulator